MGNFHKWSDIAAKHSTPEQRAKSKAAARAEVERMGYGALRKARKLTQTEIAEKLQISQPSVAALESRSDLMLSSLSKYIEALGGRLEINAVFPEATFNLAPPGSAFHEGFAASEPERKVSIKSFRRGNKAATKRSRSRAA
jgi:transcriptional regulator with XRE-family HTH domain